MKSRLPELDAIRGLAALAVVIFHYFYHYNVQYGHPNINVGWSVIGKSGVELFFMVSGFVIFMTLNRTKSALDFFVSRISRLFPAYWAAVILTYMAVSIFGLPGREVSLSSALLNLTMVQQAFGIANVDGVYWTLLVELIFYALMLGVYAIKRLDSVEIVLSCIIVFGIYYAFVTEKPDESSIQYLFPRNVSFFLAGVCFYKIANSIDTKFTYLLLVFALTSTIATHSMAHCVIYSSFYALFFLLVKNKLTLLNNRPLVYVGGISYTLYLVHANIGYIIINHAYANQINPYIGISIAMGVSFTLAALLTKYIEQPALKNIRQAYKARRFST